MHDDVTENPPLAPAESGAAGGGYILVVDDEEPILDVLIALYREDEHYEMIPARSVREALALAPNAPPAFVLMDVNLRNESAAEAAQRLRGRPGWNRVPLVVFTAAPQIDELAEQLGAEAYLAKPFNMEDALRLAERFGAVRRPSDVS
ncbi:MAG TPA: response regulator [Ktedonobacterales bacterium]|jgi:CheY-like chemotaxis protein|nr:response regulator [Ktedonobacterales bacterium]